MCFATAALVAGVAGAATTAYGSYQAGNAASSAAAYQAQVAQNNAKIADQNAQYTIAAGQVKAATQSLKGAAAGGKLKAAQAAGGVDVNSGSAVDVQQSQREQEKLDTETVMSNAELQAYGYRTASTSFTAEAGLDEMKADQAKTAGEIGAAGSLLSNASSLGFKWGAGPLAPTGTGLTPSTGSAAP